MKQTNNIELKSKIGNLVKIQKIFNKVQNMKEYIKLKESMLSYLIKIYMLT